MNLNRMRVSALLSLLGISAQALTLTSLHPTGTFLSTEHSTLVSAEEHSCALTGEGVQCWGDLGDNGFYTRVPSYLEHPRALASGDGTTCALTDNGLQCWGWGIWNNDYNMGPRDLKNPSAISVGGFHICTLTDEGVRCWGNIQDGATDVPIDLKNPRSLAMGTRHSCAITSEGVRCWGGEDNRRPNPKPSACEWVPKDLGIVDVLVSSAETSCAITAHRVRCWNSEGETQVPNLKNPSAIAIGGKHACAIADDGVHCWGDNSFGQTDVPIDLKQVRALSAGSRHTCAATEDEVRCWGKPDWKLPTPAKLKVLAGTSDSRLRYQFDRISREGYAEKSSFFKTLSRLSKSISWTLADTTLLLAIEPVLNSIHSQRLDVLLPFYLQDKDYVLQKFELEGLSSVAHKDESLRTGLQLIQAALESSQSLLSLAANREANEVMLALGQALAKPEISNAELAPLIAALTQNSTWAAEMSADPQLTGFAQMIGNLRAWMENN